MDPTTDRHDPEAPIPDEALAARVRAAVDGWTMPPQRLDQSTWRDRVGGRPSGRGRGWGVRLGGAGVAAVVVTMTAALAAVWLTTRPSPPGVAGAPSGSPGGSAFAPSASASATALPTLAVNGSLPEPSRLVVRSNGLFQVADLSTGRLGRLVTSNVDGPTTLFPRPGGGWLCVCGDWVAFSDSRPTGLAISLQTADAAGEADPPVPLRGVRGDTDPGPGGTDGELAAVNAFASPDGRVAYVAWTVRNGATGWTGGIDVVDLATASVLSSAPLKFPEPQGAGWQPARVAPQVAISPSGETVLVSRWADIPAATPPWAKEHWTAPFDGRTIGSLTLVSSSPAEGCDPIDQGLIDDARIYVLCSMPGGGVIVERNHLDGSAIDSSPLPGMTSGLSGATTVVRRGDLLYLWDARSRTLARFDLSNGRVETATATAVTPATDPLDAAAAFGRGLGRWIAPAALAKAVLDPGMVVSPDGGRVYALGIDHIDTESDRSRGVYAFDARTLESVGHWAPTADFVSLAISGDGQYVYAAGLPDRDSSGSQIDTGASITVFDTQNGAVRLIAGQLDHGSLTFPSGIAQ
jgi:hypothetical protein